MAAAITSSNTPKDLPADRPFMDAEAWQHREDAAQAQPGWIAIARSVLPQYP
jgi:hypothetical protein